jgi:hypothetical protein
MKTLHERFVQMQTEQFLKKMGGLVPLSDDQEVAEEAVAAPIASKELEQRVKKVIEDTEQFFAHFGLTPERQEELFKMPVIQKGLDEIIAGVARERVELELLFGAPRNGWDPLPFEKSAETEKILKKLLKQAKTEKIEEIYMDEIFDRSAHEQIMAIQKRLSAALEDVKKATQEQKKAMTLPALPMMPKREPLPEVASAVALPDLREKRSIDADFERHYSEQLKVVMVQKDPLQQAVAETHLFPQNEAQSLEYKGEVSDNLQTQTEQVMGESSGNSEMRTVAAIVEDIEKMHSNKSNVAKLTEPVVISEADVFTAAVVDGETPKVFKKPPMVRANGIVISALKSRMQHKDEEQLSVITEDMGQNGQRGEQSPLNLFAGVTLPGLPFSGEASSGTNDTKNSENKSKTLVAYRRQVGPHRFQL